MSRHDDLLEYIFDGGKPALYGEMAQWVQESRRFRAFAHDNRSKIRAKLRNAAGGERVNDIRAELEVAANFLRDRPFALEYEAYAALNQRGPDFTVTYKTHTRFNVEVRRIGGIATSVADSPELNRKLMAVLCEKLRQLPPSIINLLWISSDAEIPIDELARAAKTLRWLVDEKSDEFLRRCRLRDRTAFYKHYARLSGVILPGKGENAVWLNPMARHTAPRPLILALRNLTASKA